MLTDFLFHTAERLRLKTTISRFFFLNSKNKFSNWAGLNSNSNTIFREDPLNHRSFMAQIMFS